MRSSASKRRDSVRSFEARRTVDEVEVGKRLYSCHACVYVNILNAIVQALADEYQFRDGCCSDAVAYLAKQVKDEHKPY